MLGIRSLQVPRRLMMFLSNALAWASVIGVQEFARVFLVLKDLLVKEVCIWMYSAFLANTLDC